MEKRRCILRLLHPSKLGYTCEPGLEGQCLSPSKRRMLDDVPARHNDPTPSRSDGSKAPAILSRQFQGPDHEIACYLPQSDLINLISASHQSEAAFVHNLQALRLTVPASLDLRVKVQQQPEHDQEALLAGLASLLLRCYAVQRLTVSQAHAVPSGGKRLVMLGGPTGRPCWVAPLAHAMGTGGMASLQSLEVLNALDMAESRVLCAALAQGCCPRLAQLTLGHERMHVGVVDTHALAAAVQRRRELGYVLPLRRLSMTLAVSDESGAQGLESLSSCCGGDLHELRLHVVLPVAAAQCTHATMAAIGTGLACLPRLRVLAVRTSVTLPCVLPTSSSAAPLVLYSALLPSYQPAVLSDGANRGNNNQQQQPPPLPSPPSPPSLSREHAMRLSSSLVQEGAWQDMAELDLQGMRLGDAEAGILLGAMGRTQHGMAQLRTLRLQLGPGGLKALARVMEAGGFPALRALHLVMWQPGGGRQEQMQQHMGEGWGAGLVAVAEALASGAR